MDANGKPRLSLSNGGLVAAVGLAMAAALVPNRIYFGSGTTVEHYGAYASAPAFLTLAEVRE